MAVQHNYTIQRRAPLLTDLHEIFVQIDAVPLRRDGIR